MQPGLRSPIAAPNLVGEGDTFTAEPALRWLRGERTLYSSRSSPFNLHQHPAGTEILTSDQSEHLCLSKLVEMLAMSCKLKTRRDQYSQARRNALFPNALHLSYGARLSGK
jgi:hypothetical protein